VKEESLIYNPQTSFPNNEPTDVGLGIKPKSTKTICPLEKTSNTWKTINNELIV